MPAGFVPLTIGDIAFGGKGVGRSEAAGGKAVFVPFVITGEEVTARITRQKKSFAEAQLVSVEKASPFRTEPPCPYFGQCGGCSYQHIAYPEQLGIKSRQVEQTLRRVGRLSEVPMRPIVPSPRQYGYRNRIRVHMANVAVGFYRHDRHEVMDIEQCLIASPAVNRELARLRQQLRQRSRPVASHGDLTLSEQSEHPGEKRKSARDSEGGGFFTQTNSEVAEALRKLVREIVSREHATLVDAYCGAGFFARALADLFTRVLGIEANEAAVARARCTAGPREEYIAGDVALHLGEVLTTCEPARTTLILDPPAAGVEPRVIDFILAAAPAEIVYVSCDPGTLARDLGALMCGGANALESVTPLDMFPQTAGIEVVAHLRRRRESA